MGTMTDITHDVWMEGTYNAWTCATTDIPYSVQVDGDFTVISCR